MNADKISTPICDFLQGYAASGISRFHMPGHKGLPDIFSHDITEIQGADSLYEASGIIEESEENASRLFGTAFTLYSTEGSSQCIRAMLALAAGMCPQFQATDRSTRLFPAVQNTIDQTSARPLILAARNVHRSFITAAALLDLDVAWLYPEEDDHSICSCQISPAQVRDAISRMQTPPAAVYITSPDYLGNLQDIKGIAEAAHESGVPLLIDNAHGAYLHFLDDPVHPMDLGADMCCDSGHKTLPVLTGGAYLHIGRSAVYGTDTRDLQDIPDQLRTGFIENARRVMSIFGSTSPSYLILESLDHTNKLLAEGFDESIRSCAARVCDLKSDLRKSGWVLAGDEPLKITIHASACGYSGYGLADLLHSNYIECEYADPDYLVLMISPCNTDVDFEKLKPAFGSVRIVAANGAFQDAAFSDVSRFTISPGIQAMTIRKALFSPSELISVDDADGRICCDTGLSCPPAIPPVICGEIITPEAVRILKYYKITHIRVVASGISC